MNDQGPNVKAWPRRLELTTAAKGDPRNLSWRLWSACYASHTDRSSFASLKETGELVAIISLPADKSKLPPSLSRSVAD